MWWPLKRFFFKIIIKSSNYIFGKEFVHRSTIAKLLNRFWLNLVEYISPARRRQARFERENPNSPWFVPEAINYIEKEIKPEFVGFEWGCGRSTEWFARRVRHITSVEGRRSWFDEVSRRIASADLKNKVTMCLAEVTTEHQFSPDEIERYVSVIDTFSDSSLDFVVVDGHFRDECLQRVGKKLSSEGLLIIDNSDVVSEKLLDSLMTNKTMRWNNGIWETTVIQM